MKNITTTFLVMLSLSSSILYAQKYFNNNFYLMNPYSYNLAYAGESKELVTTTQFAGQNRGLQSSPQTNSLFVRKGFLREAGLGLRLIIDQRGVFSSTSIAFESSYRVVVNPGAKHYISFGLGGRRQLGEHRHRSHRREPTIRHERSYASRGQRSAIRHTIRRRRRLPNSRLRDRPIYALYPRPLRRTKRRLQLLETLLCSPRIQTIHRRKL